MRFIARLLDRFVEWVVPLDIAQPDWADELSEWEETHEVFEASAAESPLVGGGASQIPPSVVPPEGLGIAQPRAQTFGPLNFLRNRG